MSDDWGLDVHQEVLYVSEEQDRYEANTDEGFVLLSRSFVSSSLWLQDNNVVRLALYLITRANWKPGKFDCKYLKRQIVVGRGEMITSLDRITERIQVLTKKQVRLALSKLKSAGFVQDITPEPVKRAHGYLMLRIGKYDTYQNQGNYQGTRRAHGGHTEGTRRAHIEEGNKGIRETDIDIVQKTSQNGLFEEFWSLYPKKEAKGTAEKAWKKLPAESKRRIIEILPKYEFHYDRQYIPLPATWLNSKRWEDEIHDPISKQQQTKQTIEEMKRATIERLQQEKEN